MKLHEFYQRTLSKNVRISIGVILCILFLWTLYGALFLDRGLYVVIILIVTGPLAVLGCSMIFATEKKIQLGYLHPLTLYVLGCLMIFSGIYAIATRDLKIISKAWVLFIMGPSLLALGRKRSKIREYEKRGLL